MSEIATYSAARGIHLTLLPTLPALAARIKARVQGTIEASTVAEQVDRYARLIARPDFRSRSPIACDYLADAMQTAAEAPATALPQGVAGFFEHVEEAAHYRMSQGYEHFCDLR